ncbi:hypothetical protein L484_023305 [Morus notabilis]|uniref:Uncharacterized protein n=1 Tax=Morus notabilis TaxID=981085 RepID=W9RN94_9ROSA|nr:hypothetical protein L484_023305 [Morus notabilis]
MARRARILISHLKKGGEINRDQRRCWIADLRRRQTCGLTEIGRRGWVGCVGSSSVHGRRVELAVVGFHREESFIGFSDKELDTRRNMNCSGLKSRVKLEFKGAVELEYARENGLVT